ncbi:branched-chain amino acid aminotransferase [Aquimarina sp. EL_43]|uniref:aminotransferase class IV n=1 Tax=Aquimarina TaxID=290174 RepID=UPI000472C8F9|nr:MULTISPECIES: aminotransferase class IV [Aquimarina]MBG6130807.1 branched-chain amino acid aminotransferase [Aquimarina sp. EL_35]MBG6151046.1 branched-chain amino acid aminotransferase [Aquimarina sp. EL_32]MBG6169197.1 branched-chain amino acid aminotransferase [Aquimarina sp. EL_43]
MVNINGNLLEDHKAVLAIDNRGYAYGDALFETIRVNSGTILFWEDHYFRLMASMRILRMQIPMSFTPEFLEKEIIDLITANELMNASVRIKIMVNRVAGGLYTPASSDIEYNILVSQLQSNFYTISDQKYEVTLFKDHYVSTDMLSTLKSTNKLVNVLGGIFARENGFDNCLLINSDKMVIEALNGNLFLVKGNTIKTPPITDGCLKGILRTQLLRILEKLPEYQLEEASISPFELQKADELFVTNVITGILPITKFRKKEYTSKTSKRLLGILNTRIRLGN